MLDRLRRVTDLFVEGAEAFLGLDDDGVPVVIWVNKLNSFEVEEARQDGIVARGMALMQLSKEDNSERAALIGAMIEWSDDEVISGLVDQKSEHLYIDVLNDMEADEDWKERLTILRRLPELLRDADAATDDPRRTQLYDLQTEYLEEMRVRREKAEAEARREFDGMTREELEKAYFDNWSNRNSLDEFMAARRVTELFFAMRDCRATQESERDLDGHIRWNHSTCDHSKRLLNERSQVKSLPEGVLAKVSQVIEDITVNGRDSGNSDAPQSSSGSAGQQSEPEASSPSSPEEKPLAAATT